MTYTFPGVGRDVFVRFQTDHGNAGISSSIDPGFFLE